MQVHLVDGKTIWKQEWKEVGGKKVFFRSKFEYRYALYLQLLKEHGEITDWFHEKRKFVFKGVESGAVSYLPDFLVIHKNGSEEYIETKGYEQSSDRTKWKRMAKYYPEVKLRIVRSDWLGKNSKALKALIPCWE
jgi:hypothetical protein